MSINFVPHNKAIVWSLRVASNENQIHLKWLITLRNCYVVGRFEVRKFSLRDSGAMALPALVSFGEASLSEMPTKAGSIV